MRERESLTVSDICDVESIYRLNHRTSSMISLLCNFIEKSIAQ